MTAALIAVLTAVVAATLVYQQVRHVRAVRAERGALFDQVAHLFDGVTIRQDGLNYPVLTGTFHGHGVKLEPVLDTLAFRKLPVLWLQVTHYRPLPVGAPLDVLVRPHGHESFSPNLRYGQEIPPGEAYPEHVRIATPDVTAAPDLALLDRFVAFLRERDTKEMLVASRGVRIVRRLGEAEQAHYRVTRRVELHAELTTAELSHILSTLVALGDAASDPDREEPVAAPGGAAQKGPVS